MGGECIHNLWDKRVLKYMGSCGFYCTPLGMRLFKIFNVGLTSFIIHLYEGIGTLRLANVDGKEFGDDFTEGTIYRGYGWDCKVNMWS